MPKGFQKGNKLSLGRPKGSKDVKTEQWSLLGEYITQQGADRYMNALIALEDKDYVDKFEKILEYFKPKLARSEVTGKDGERLFPKPIMDALPKDNSDKKDKGDDKKN